MINSENGPESLQLIGNDVSYKGYETSRVKMDKGSIKKSFIAMLKGAHENRFVPFNDLPKENSKYQR